MSKCVDLANELVEELKKEGADDGLVEEAQGLADLIEEEYEEEDKEDDSEEEEDKPEEGESESQWAERKVSEGLDKKPGLIIEISHKK